MLAPSLPGRSHPVNLVVRGTSPPGQGTDNHALLVKDVEVPPLHRFDMIIASDFLLEHIALLLPELWGLLHRNYEGIVLLFERRADYSPGFPQSQQAMKYFFR